MNKLIQKFEGKLYSQGISQERSARVAVIDSEIEWNRKDSTAEKLESLFSRLNINSLIFAKPAEPYFSIMEKLTERITALTPHDCESRTFLHDIPVIDSFDIERIAEALGKRKGVIVKGEGIITYGNVSPEQAFVTQSSICFASFVKYFSDIAESSYRGIALPESERKFASGVIALYLSCLERELPSLAKAPFSSESEILSAMAAAGRATVDYRLVDSFFGNISYREGDTIYISETGSSLDELDGLIDACPLDGSTCAALTASSEFKAHREILACSGSKAILHGHPRFAVIMSMACRERESCSFSDRCFRECPACRSINDIAVVPGEVGTGKFGLCNTLPPAMKDSRGAIVYGHGLFCNGKDDYTDAFRTMIEVEKMCVEEYKRRFLKQS